MADIATEQLAAEEEERQRVEYLRMQALDRARQVTARTPLEDVGKEDQRIGWVMFACMILLSVIADSAEVITGGTLGWFVGLFADFVLLVTLGLTKSGKSQFRRVLAAVIGEKIPFINMLPLRTLFVIWAFLKSRSAVAQMASYAVRIT